VAISSLTLPIQKIDSVKYKEMELINYLLLLNTIKFSEKAQEFPIKPSYLTTAISAKTQKFNKNAKSLRVLLAKNL
jgi:hypothetical protein